MSHAFWITSRAAGVVALLASSGAVTAGLLMSGRFVRLSYYWRARIGVKRWRVLHRFTALAWLLGVAHAIGQGTDAGTPWLIVSVAAVALPALGLLTMRLAPRTA